MMKRSALLLLCVLSACAKPRAPAKTLPSLDGPVAMRTTPDADYRSTAPIATTVAPFTPPKILEKKLKNGIRVLFVERHDVPVVALRVVSDRGADQADPGIGQFWERAALRASTSHPSYEVLEAWNDLGAFWRAHATHDSSQLEIRVMAKLLVPAAKMLGELTAQPAFPTNQVKLIRERLRVEISNDWDDAAGQLKLAIHDHLFPEKHPYHSAFAPPDSVEKVEGGLLEAYQKYAFTPEHMTIVAAGDATLDELVAAVEPAFGALSGPKIGPQAPPKPPTDPPNDPRFIVIPRSGTQATIGAGWLGPSRDIDDLHLLAVAEQSLSSALYTRLRVERGITYDVDFVATHGRAMRPAYIETAVEIEHAGHAVEEIVKAVEQFNKQLVHEKSLAEDRAAVSDFADLFSSVSATAATLAHLAVYSLPLDYYSRRADAIAGVSPTDLRATFNRYMTVERLKFFVVGDVVRVLPQLEVLGLGKVAVHPAFKLIKG